MRDFTAMNLLAQTSSPMLAPSGESLSFFLDMEIKVGDKVRMSKDAPKLLFTRSICNYPEYVFEVRAIEDDIADIYYGAGKIPLAAFVIPTKYLIKVKDEAKEPKFKKGDKVRFKKIYTVVSVDDGQVFIDSAGNHFDEDCLELYTEPTEQTIKVGDVVRCKSPLRLKNSTDDDFIGTVTDVENGWFIVHMNNGAVFQACNAVDLELVQPKEQTEEAARIRQMEAELDEFRKAELDKVLHPEKYHTYEVTIDNVAMNWQRYEADLAKEIAVKLSKPNENKPGYVADYAVSVAKAVVENLKKK